LALLASLPKSFSRMRIGIGLLPGARQAAKVLLYCNSQGSVLRIQSNFVAGRPNPHCLGWYKYGNCPVTEVGMEWLGAGAALNPVREPAAGPERGGFLHRTVAVQPHYFGSGKAKAQRVAL